MFVVCGEALWDLFAIEGPDGLGFDARIGGSPFNVAVGLARLGQDSALFTGLSSDRLGARLDAALEREGVDTRFVVRTDRPSTLSLVDLGPDGSPAYVFYGKDAADRSITLEDLPAFGPEVWGLHAGSFSLVAEPVGSSLLALFGREAGRRLLTLDPNVRLNVEPDREIWRTRLAAFMAHADIVKVSAEDLELLYPGSDPASIAADWRAAGVGLVIVTHGRSGASAFSPAGEVAIPGRSVTVVDTVGAGDSFQAGLVAALAERGISDRGQVDGLDSQTLSALLDFASAAAAITCTRRGADLPMRDELPSLPQESA